MHCMQWEISFCVQYNVRSSSSLLVYIRSSTYPSCESPIKFFNSIITTLSRRILRFFQQKTLPPIYYWFIKQVPQLQCMCECRRKTISTIQTISSVNCNPSRSVHRQRIYDFFNITLHMCVQCIYAKPQNKPLNIFTICALFVHSMSMLCLLLRAACCAAIARWQNTIAKFLPFRDGHYAKIAWLWKTSKAKKKHNNKSHAA